LQQQVAERHTQEIVIEVEDLHEYYRTANMAGFVDRIIANCNRYVNLFSKAIDKKMPEPREPVSDTNMDAQDYIELQRRGNIKANGSAEQKFPPELMRRYQLFFVFGEQAKKKVTKMREIRAEQIGNLILMKGIVIRLTDVKPCIQVATFACDICGYEAYQQVNGKEFNPLNECPSEKCVKNQTKGQLFH
jgi:DNA replication licensing factor MCM7